VAITLQYRGHQSLEGRGGVGCQVVGHLVFFGGGVRGGA
jgi:hypothetical protein